MLFLFGRFNQGVNHITQHVEWLVYIAALSQSLALDVGVFDTLTAGKVDDVEFRFFDFDDLIFFDFWFNEYSENDMRAWAFGVHWRIRCGSCFVSLEEQLYRLFVGYDSFFVDALYKNSLPQVLSYLVLPFVVRELHGAMVTRS